MKRIREYIKGFIYKLRGEVTTEALVKNGMKVGNHFSRQNNVFLDPGHCWLIEIGNNVTLAPRVTLLCHDASTKKHIGYTKIGKIVIGDNVFVGANSVILPGVRVGDNVVIGANSTISKDIPAGSVVVGSPAKEICSLDDYLRRMNALKENALIYDEKYTVRGNITTEMKKEMCKALESNRIAFVE